MMWTGPGRTKLPRGTFSLQWFSEAWSGEKQWTHVLRWKGDLLNRTRQKKIITLKKKYGALGCETIISEPVGISMVTSIHQWLTSGRTLTALQWTSTTGSKVKSKTLILIQGSWFFEFSRIIKISKYGNKIQEIYVATDKNKIFSWIYIENILWMEINVAHLWSEKRYFISIRHYFTREIVIISHFFFSFNAYMHTQHRFFFFLPKKL